MKKIYFGIITLFLLFLNLTFANSFDSDFVKSNTEVAIQIDDKSYSNYQVYTVLKNLFDNFINTDTNENEFNNLFKIVNKLEKGISKINSDSKSKYGNLFYIFEFLKINYLEKLENSIVFNNEEQNILKSLITTGFIDINYFYSQESLEAIPLLVEKLLIIEKNNFYKILSLPNEEISFGSFKENEIISNLYSFLNHLDKVDTNNLTQDVINNIKPKLINFQNELSFSKELYNKLVYCLENCELDEDQLLVIQGKVDSYEDYGINLDVTLQSRLKEISLKLSDLEYTFGINALESENEFSYLFENDETINTMPQEVLNYAKNAALEKGKNGYLFGMDGNSYSYILKYCTDENVRKHYIESYRNLATTGDKDNRKIVMEILKLRDEQAKILGFENFGEFSMVSKMADSPSEVIKLEDEIVKKAKVKALSDLEKLKEYYNLENIDVWDLSYYIRKYNEEFFDIDHEQLKEYFEYNNVLSGMFFVANKLFDLSFVKVDGTLYNNNVDLFEVYKKGQLKGYLMLDMFYNPNKSAGAWASILRNKSLNGDDIVYPIIGLVSSIHPTEGANLLTYYDVETMFHEFGHAIHALLSDSIYKELNGFSVERDFVEVPSQLMENWSRGDGLKYFAKNYKTNEIISDEYIDKLVNSSNFFVGNQILNSVIFSRFDMLVHTQEVPKSVDDLDNKYLEIYNSFSLFPTDNTKSYATFLHIFEGGYSAGYYSYLWSEIIEADIFSLFSKKGLFDKQLGEKYYETILSKGSTLPAKEMFFNFMGREVDIQGYLNKKGL